MLDFMFCSNIWHLCKIALFPFKSKNIAEYKKEKYFHSYLVSNYLPSINIPTYLQYFYGNYRERVRKTEAQYNLPEKKTNFIPKLFTLKMEN